jgi:type II restriction/modification system DNA methylase subunit YeeA
MSVEYTLLRKDNNSHITVDNYREISARINEAFPEKGSIPVNKMGERIRETYGINGNAFNIYYRENETKICIPEKNEESIKEKLESLGLKCQ